MNLKIIKKNTKLTGIIFLNLSLKNKANNNPNKNKMNGILFPESRIPVLKIHIAIVVNINFRIFLFFNIKTVKKLDESINITLEYQNTSDPRKDIFNYAVEKEWILTEMSLTRKNLEDIFRNLTGQGVGGTDE